MECLDLFLGFKAPETLESSPHRKSPFNVLPIEIVLCAFVPTVETQSANQITDVQPRGASTPPTGSGSNYTSGVHSCRAVLLLRESECLLNYDFDLLQQQFLTYCVVKNPTYVKSSRDSLSVHLKC